MEVRPKAASNQMCKAHLHRNFPLSTFNLPDVYKRQEAGQSIICAKTAFLAAEESVDFSIFFKKSVKTGVFGGAGFILQKLTGPGLVFLELNGSTIEYNLEEGQTINVDVYKRQAHHCL